MQIAAVTSFSMSFALATRAESFFDSDLSVTSATASSVPAASASAACCVAVHTALTATSTAAMISFSSDLVIEVPSAPQVYVIWFTALSTARRCELTTGAMSFASVSASRPVRSAAAATDALAAASTALDAAAVTFTSRVKSSMDCAATRSRSAAESMSPFPCDSRICLMMIFTFLSPGRNCTQQYTIMATINAQINETTTM